MNSYLLAFLVALASFATGHQFIYAWEKYGSGNVYWYSLGWIEVAAGIVIILYIGFKLIKLGIVKWKTEKVSEENQ